MAVEHEGGNTYRTSDGKTFSSEYEAHQHQYNGGGGFGMGKEGQAAGGAILVVAFIVIAVVIIVMTVIWTIVIGIKQFPMYIPVFVLALAAYITINKVLPLNKGLRLIAGIAAAAAVFLIGSVPAGMVYNSTLDPPVYTEDYTAGSAAVRAGRHGKGKELATLEAGTKVKVQGITRDREDFKVSLADGKTGYLPPSAFPADALPRKDLALLAMINNALGGQVKSGGAVGKLGESFKLAREEYHPMPRDVAKVRATDFARNGNGYVIGLSAQAMRSARAVKQTVPVQWLKKWDFLKDSTAFEQDPAYNPTLTNVIYLNEATIVQMELPTTKKEADRADWERRRYIFMSDMGTDWNKSLTLRDIDSGETFPLKWQEDYTYGGDSDFLRGTPSIMYFFAPTKSRHFALEHTADPLTISPVEKFFLSRFLSKWSRGSWSNPIVSWNVPEVRVK